MTFSQGYLKIVNKRLGSKGSPINPLFTSLKQLTVTWETVRTMYLLNFADDVLSILDVLENISYDDFTNLAFKTGKLTKQGAKVAYKLSLDTVWVLTYLGAICYLLGRELAAKKPLTQVCTAELEAPTSPQSLLETPKAEPNVVKKSSKRGSPVHKEQTTLDNPKGSRRGGRVAKKQG